ncbi:hypothetical protein B0T14DRAFT_521803 [Immersiella caudata]|uniref:Uncharacterized protein n=1 Tax=Immersiella caudata TaxID=314043 RepID=A0AA39WS63_9PEZI|nr:hypothetical protein B0T14DRAFT_521803 [Immersiella caudata]
MAATHKTSPQPSPGRPTRKPGRTYPATNTQNGRTLPQPAFAAEGEPVCKTDLRRVLGFIRAHKSYTPPSEDAPIEGEWPKFDDISRYDISEAQEDALWRLEAERLLAAVSDFNKPLQFESPLPSWPINKVEFENLSELGNQALHCLSICSHDNQLLLFDSYRDRFEPRTYLRARSILSSAFIPSDENTNAKGRRQGRECPADLNIHDLTYEIFCAMVDYTTAILARFALQGIPIEFWHTRALAGLAKTSAKMKYLFSDLEKLALQSLDDGQDLLAKTEVISALGSRGPVLDIVGPDGRPFQVRESEGRGDSDAMDVHHLLNREEASSTVYFQEMAMIGSWTIDALRAIFFFFQHIRASGYRADAFDICALVYKAGTTGLMTLVCQDRSGELTGSSSREYSRLSYAGFKMLSQVANELNRSVVQASTNKAEGPADVPRSHEGASLIFDFEEEDATRIEPRPRESLRTRIATMGDLASALVPLLCTQPIQLNNLVWAMEIVTRVSSVTHTINYNALRGRKYVVFASLRTDAYERDIQPTLEDSDTRPLSRSLIAQNRLHTYDYREDRSTKVWDGLPVTEKSDLILESEKKLHQLEEQFQRWTIEEKAVVVPKAQYVVMLMIVCSVLVISGIMIGVFLGSRLEGVDPFNITVFLWVLAGFILLASKSVLVSDWPWRDFLRLRVPCRSISELQGVTGVDPQEILEYLLSMELYTILITKGPYNKPFARRSEDGGDGFSIDVKIQLKTLMASGIIMVKVAGRQGLGLICLDLRRGSPGRDRICHSDDIEEDEYALGCFDLPEEYDEDQDVRLLMQGSGRGWTRILGIYHCPKREFR